MMRPRGWRRAAATALFAAIVVIVGVAGQRAEAAPYAAIVMDMRTGEVVHARGADRKQHPASLTKMMTLYLTFDAIKSGQLRLDQKVRVSRHASRQPPSKLGLRSGQRVRVRDLIRATAIKSANDAAMVLAEAIGGSQKGFARLMTRTAKRLGMASSTFKNPHGLTQRGHLSTARDMARLARRLYFDHPEYYNVFGRKSTTAAGKRIYTTNRLLSTYRGAEGMKTGYTRAAGYNLVAIANRAERRVIAIVMGGKSSRWRNDRVASLLDMGFKRTPAVAAIRRPASGTSVATAPMPAPRPGGPSATATTGLAAIGGALASTAVASADPGSRLAPLYAAPPRRRPWPSQRQATVAKSTASSAAESAILASAARSIAAVDAALSSGTAGSAVPLPATRPGDTVPSGWRVQIGAYRDRRSAEARLDAMGLKGLPMLSKDRSQITHQRSRAGKSLYIVRFHGLERTEAREACQRLKKSGRDCLALAPRRGER